MYPFRRRFPLAAGLLLVSASACDAPAPIPESDEWLELGATDQALGVTCVGTQDCSGSGSVYASTYRVGGSPTGSGELVQTFVPTSTVAPARLFFVARSLRAFTGSAPLFHVSAYGPLTGRVEDTDFVGLTPVLTGSLPITSISRTGQTGVDLASTGPLVAGATYALHFSAEGLGSGSETTLVGVGALSAGAYGGGSAFRASLRSSTPWGALQPTRFRPAATWDVAFAFSGAAGSPCATPAHCSAGHLCHAGTCVLPNPTHVSITPAAPSVFTDTITPFSATGGDTPYTFALLSGVGSVSGGNYTAPSTAGSAVVRVTDAYGFTSDASVTVLPASQVVSCTGLPANAAWNTASSITQTWSGSAFLPSNTGTWSATPSTTTCVFDCTTGTWNGTSCAVSPLPVTAGLAAHYDARVLSSITKDGSNLVSQWNDLSGNGRHLTPNGGSPVYNASLLNAHPGLDFSLGKGLISGAFPITTNVTVFAVVQWRASGSWGTIAHHGHRDNDWSLEQNGLSSANMTHFQSVNDNASVQLVLSQGTNYVLTGRLNGSARFYSATSAATTVSATGSGNSISLGNKVFYVGRSEVNETSNAYVGELLYYNRALSDGERDQVRAWLSSQWIATPPAPPAGLVHCWSGDGTGADAVGSNYANVFSNISYTAGRSGQAFSCNGGAGGPGTSVAMSAPPTISSSGPWTYEFWIRRDSAIEGTWIFDREYAGFSGTGLPLVDLATGAAGNSAWLVRNDAGAGITTPPFVLNAGQWYHLAIVRTDGLIKTYRSGVSLGDVVDPGGAITLDPPRLCSHADTPGTWMTGLFDSVKIWNRALSASEILNIANGDSSCTAAP